MRIAMISTPFERTPPVRYGGTERVVSLLTEELVRRGHDVTLFATGDSCTNARLVSFYDAPVQPYASEEHLIHVARSLRAICNGAYDLVHNHTEFGIPFSVLLPVAIVTTLHSFADRQPWAPLVPTIYEEFHDAMYVAISDAQAENAKKRDLNIVSRVYNAVDAKAYTHLEKPGSYLVYLGMIGPHKGVQHTITVAQRTGIPLKIAGRRFNRPYFKEFNEKLIDPYLDGTFIEYLGELNDTEKMLLLKGALVALVPSVWEEPFGLVTIESMACGTPVIAFDRGSARELIVNGVTGFVVENIEEMVAAVARVGLLNRAQCREHVVKNFNVEQMVTGYEQVYAGIVER